MSRNGFFIVFEGLDGAGKTTIAKMLTERLNEMGFKTIYTYEPTDSDIVKLLKTSFSELRDPFIDALVFALDRLIHIKTEIVPAIEQGYIVICDRYLYSSVAYQSAHGAPFDWILEINRYAIKPNIAIYLDVDPSTALRRKTGYESRFPEFEKYELLAKVREAYFRLVSMGLLKLIDASREITEVYRDVENYVLTELGKRSLSLFQQ
ncbi:MAG: dTMP kinase [Desulfurococcaceae archaeon]